MFNIVQLSKIPSEYTSLDVDYARNFSQCFSDLIDTLDNFEPDETYDEYDSAIIHFDMSEDIWDMINDELYQADVVRIGTNHYNPVLLIGRYLLDTGTISKGKAVSWNFIEEDVINIEVKCMDELTYALMIKVSKMVNRGELKVTGFELNFGDDSGVTTTNLGSIE